jgi:hypothetical protein
MVSLCLSSLSSVDMVTFPLQLGSHVVLIEQTVMRSTCFLVTTMAKWYAMLKVEKFADDLFLIIVIDHRNSNVWSSL